MLMVEFLIQRYLALFLFMMNVNLDEWGHVYFKFDLAAYQ